MTTLPENREPLLRFLSVQVKLDADLAAVLREAARDTERRIARSRGVLHTAQLAAVLRDLRQIQHELWVRGVGERVAARLQDAREAASRAARALDRFLVNVAGERRASVLTEAFSRRVERGLQVDASRVPQQLSMRVYRNADLSSKRIERIIRAGVIRGMGAREIADQVKPLINPSVRGGVSYAAMRLGRTELNNAFHEQQKLQAERDWVLGVKWNLSLSHPRKDECNDYADHDEGLGRGVWDKHRVPDKPHPQCMCYMTYDVMTPDQAVELIAAQAI